MSNYDYKESKKKVKEILTSKTEIVNRDTIPADEDQFTYENGITSFVGALFVDIRDSTEYFKNKPEIVSRVMRAFCSEIISILKQDDNWRDIGIRGDCVYAIFTAPHIKDLIKIFDHALVINAFQNMFQEILFENSLPEFEIGIGLGCGKCLIVKAGKKWTGINDYIWIGKAVIDASNFSSIGGKNGKGTIVMNKCFHYNLMKDVEFKRNYDKVLKQDYYKNDYNTKIWHTNAVNPNYDEWN